MQPSLQALKKEARLARKVPSIISVSDTISKGSKKDPRTKTPPDKKKARTFDQPSPPIQEEPEPFISVLQGDEIQALAIKVEDLEKLHTPQRPQAEEKTPITKTFLIRRHRPEEVGKKTHLLVAYPADAEESKKPLTYSGPGGQFAGSCEQILPHSILGSLQEFKKEAVARGDVQVAELIDDSHLDVTMAALEKYREKQGGGKRKKFDWTPPSQHKALQNWHRNMALRKKQQKSLCMLLQKPADELLMNLSDDFRRVQEDQEERSLIDRCLPALHPGKGYRVGSEFWSQSTYIGDELTGLTLTLTQKERGYPEPVTHIGKPRTIRMETGSQPPKEPPFRLTWDKSLFLKHRRQELKSLLEELDFNQPDLDGLEVIGKGEPFTSVSAQPFPPSEKDNEVASEKPESPDPLEDYPDVVPEPVFGPSLNFCGQPARWISSSTSHKDEVGIAARLTFEVLAGEKVESYLTVSNDGTAAIWYDWRRLPQKVIFEETKMKGIPRFYFNTRPGVILPGETRHFSFFFKSEKAGVFSESWEFGTCPELLGGALLKVSLWGIAVYQDKLAGLREEVKADLAEREMALIVEENLKELLDRIRTPEQIPSPVNTYLTEEDLFHRKNPGLHYQHQVVKDLQALWSQSTSVPPPSEEDEISQQKSAMQELSSQKEISGCQSTLEVTRRKSVIEELTHQPAPVEDEEPTQSDWNFSFKDFKQAIQSIPTEDQQEAALAQLNKAALELCMEQKPAQSDLLYQMCLQLWREAIDGLVSHSLMLRSLLGMPEKDPYVEIVPEETVDSKQIVKGGKEERKIYLKEEKKTAGGKEKEEKKGTAKLTGKDKEERPNSRKLKGDKRFKTSSFVREAKELILPVDTVDSEHALPRQEQVDPTVLEKYHEKLYVGVYSLLGSMVSTMASLMEELLKKGCLEAGD
ncbi:MYCBP-associated protein [Alligator sinensis]|uniref:MYCBP-associated protein n=1 Tax=Alligator sinensis TaxID=38654 RepID=A0A1U7RGX1_ALLSI|nr:MYCBP-associated protein [Alligator sinensis]